MIRVSLILGLTLCMFDMQRVVYKIIPVSASETVGDMASSIASIYMVVNSGSDHGVRLKLMSTRLSSVGGSTRVAVHPCGSVGYDRSIRLV